MKRHKIKIQELEEKLLDQYRKADQQTQEEQVRIGEIEEKYSKIIKEQTEQLKKTKQELSLERLNSAECMENYNKMLQEVQQNKRTILKLETNITTAESEKNTLQTKINKNEMESNELEIEINDLETELRESIATKNKFEKDLKRKELDMESKNEKAPEYATKIKDLEQKLQENDTESAKQRQEFRKTKEIFKTEIQELKFKINRMTVTNESLRKTIDILEKNANILVSKVSSDNLNYLSSNKNSGDKNIKRKEQMLLLSGKNGYNYGKLLKRITSSTFDINCQYSKNNNMEEIIRYHDVLSQGFTENDFKIIFWSPEDLRQRRNNETSVLREILNRSKEHNLIIVGCSYVPNKYALNRLIEQQNERLSAYLTKEKRYTFIDINKIVETNNIDEFGELTYQGKEKVMKHIYTIIKRKDNGTQTNISDFSTTVKEPLAQGTNTQNPKSTNSVTIGDNSIKKTSETVLNNKNENANISTGTKPKRRAMKIVEPARTNEEITSESHPPFLHSMRLNQIWPDLYQ